MHIQSIENNQIKEYQNIKYEKAKKYTKNLIKVIKIKPSIRLFLCNLQINFLKLIDLGGN